MSLEKILQNRDEILQSSKDEDGFISSQGVINEFLQYMTDSKLLDSEEISEVSKRGLLDGYSINESGERLQLFVVDENSLAESLSEEEIFFSERSKFVKIFDNTSKYILRAFKGLEIENSQDSDPAKVLMTFLSENDAKVKFDVVEIFLISLTATVVRQIDGLHPQDIYFSEDKFPIKYVDEVTVFHSFMFGSMLCCRRNACSSQHIRRIFMSSMCWMVQWCIRTGNRSMGSISNIRGWSFNVDHGYGFIYVGQCKRRSNDKCFEF